MKPEENPSLTEDHYMSNPILLRSLQRYDQRRNQLEQDIGAAPQAATGLIMDYITELKEEKVERGDYSLLSMGLLFRRKEDTRSQGLDLKDLVAVRRAYAVSILAEGARLGLVYESSKVIGLLSNQVGQASDLLDPTLVFNVVGSIGSGPKNPYTVPGESEEDSSDPHYQRIRSKGTYSVSGVVDNDPLGSKSVERSQDGVPTLEDAILIPEVVEETLVVVPNDVMVASPIQPDEEKTSLFYVEDLFQDRQLSEATA